MRSIVLALAMFLTLSSVTGMAANKPAKVNPHHGKVKPQKPKKVKTHARAN